jgi:hypothetical protein
MGKREFKFYTLLGGVPILIALMITFSGCASMKQAEFWDHPTVYTSWDHMKFSAWGYRNPDMSDHYNSQMLEYWGKPVEINIKDIH